jgi:6-phosphogluconate dehydrogenase
MTDTDSCSNEADVARLDGPTAVCLTRMVHDGVEHSHLQLASEVLHLTQRVLAVSGEQLRHFLYSGGTGALDARLLEVSNRLFKPALETLGRRKITEKLDSFKRDPANRRLSQLAAEFHVAAPTIDVAVCGKEGSGRERQALFLLTLFRHPSGHFKNDPASVLRELCGAYYCAMVITYAQGFALLAKASVRHRFNLNLARIAASWNADLSARSELLDDIATAFEATPSLPNLLCDENLSENVMAHQECLRHAVWRASELDIIMPGMLASLDYLDAFKDAWLPFNLVSIRPVPIHDRWNWGRVVDAEIVRP